MSELEQAFVDLVESALDLYDPEDTDETNDIQALTEVTSLSEERAAEIMKLFYKLNK